MAKTARLTQLSRQCAFTPLTCRSIAPFPPAARRLQSTAAPVNPRWLFELQERVAKINTKYLEPELAQEAGNLSRYVRSNWMELLAGREGFLTAKEWRGLDGHEIAWGDMDMMVSHVNNVKYNRYAESARVNWVGKYAELSSPEHKQQWTDLMTPRGIGLILRSIRTDYKFPMEYPDRATVLHKLVSRPDYDTDHFLLEAVILSERFQRPAARCFEDIVVFDYQRGKKTPLKGFMVDEFRKTFELQERSREEAEGRVGELVKTVERLEAAAQ